MGPPQAPPLLRWLRSQKTNVVCALAAAALLGVGTVIADRAPDAYADLSLDDVRFFFAPLRPIHAWFYLLCGVLAVWATSALVVTWDGVVSRVRARLWRPTAWGSVVFHVAFPLALVAHLWGGLAATVEMHRVGPIPSSLAGAQVRLIGVEEAHHPDGSTRMVTATLERRVSDDDAPETVTVAYNQPILSRFGAHELLLLRHFPVPGAVLSAPGGPSVALVSGQRAVVGDRVVTLGRLFDGDGLHAPVAEVLVEFPVRQAHFVVLGASTPDGSVAFAALRPSAMLLILERWNPSVPLVLIVALLAVIGAILTAGERLVRRRATSPRS